MDARIQQAMAQAKTSLQVEGFEITKQHDVLVAAVLSGEMTEQEFFKKVDTLISNKDS